MLTLHELFLEQAVRTPGAPAVIGAGWELSFGDLAERAHGMALALRGRQLESESLVGVCLGRSLDLPPCLLGIALAGYAYMPLDPWHSTERSAQILQGARPRCLIVDHHGCRQHAVDGKGVVHIDALTASAPRRPVETPHPTCEGLSDPLAYVIYTSGSTGTPKGVEITHRGAVNTLVEINRLCAVGSGDRVLNVSPVGFDLSVYDLFGAWAAGAAVVLPRDTGYPEPREWVRSLTVGKVSIWNSAPALLEIVLDLLERDAEMAARCFEHLRIVMLSGDRISVRLLRRIMRIKPGVRVLAMGGATEASIWSCYQWAEHLPPESEFVPYGTALPNQRLVILDPDLNPVPVGQAGQLYIGGMGLARGYRGRPDLTAASFIDDPHEPGARLYATGDKVRRLPHGNTEFLGRLDHQVKIRGFRVEPAEIEQALLRLPGVEQAVVTSTQSAQGTALCAYMVLGRNAAARQCSDIRASLSELLPGYMVPEQFRFLAQMPVNSNGKVDRNRLHACSTAARPLEVVVDAPLPCAAGTTQQAVAAIWRDVLSLEQIGADEHFLDAGGNSLLASQIANRLSELFQIDIDIRDLFENPTIVASAAAIDDWLATRSFTALAPS